MLDIKDYPLGQLAGAQSIAGATRVLYYVLSAGLEVFSKDSSNIDRVFRLYSGDERETIKKYLKSKPLKVFHGYPRQDQPQMPFALVMKTLETTDTNFLGNFMGVDRVEDVVDVIGGGYHDSTDLQVTHGARTTVNMETWIYSDHKDVLDYYYDICWAIIDASKMVFEKLGMMPGPMSGTETTYDPRMYPDYQYFSRIIMPMSGSRTYALDTDLLSEILITVSDMVTGVEVHADSASE